jgi:hypothetical protein
MCFENGRTACQQEKQCKICFEKSFASCEKSKHWSDKNEIKPWQVTYGTDKKYLFKCDKSRHEFLMSPNQITNKNTWCPYPCCNVNGGGGSILCLNDECEICFCASFSSNEKSKFWSDKNILKPKEVLKNSNKKFWFKCDKSNHEFEISISDVTRTKGRWCPYPCCAKPSMLLCLDEKCKICFHASFASHEKSKFWSDKNDLQPINVFKGTSKKFWFKCDKSEHEFETSLNSITTMNTWCPYPCCNTNGNMLCIKNCNFCFNASFASHEKSKFWSNKNKSTPREFSKNSTKKFWFNCEKDHEFEINLHNVNNKQWCSFCHIWKNQIECLQILTEITGKEFRQLRPKFLNRLELDCYNEELKLALEYNGKQHYKYNPFFHRNNKENLIKQQERDKLKQELCDKNGIYLIIVPYWEIDKKTFIEEKYSNYILSQV